jgi:hypothetical protein
MANEPQISDITEYPRDRRNDKLTEALETITKRDEYDTKRMIHREHFEGNTYGQEIFDSLKTDGYLVAVGNSTRRRTTVMFARNGVTQYARLTAFERDFSGPYRLFNEMFMQSLSSKIGAGSARPSHLLSYDKPFSNERLYVSAQFENAGVRIEEFFRTKFSTFRNAELYLDALFQNGNGVEYQLGKIIALGMILGADSDINPRNFLFDTRTNLVTLIDMFEGADIRVHKEVRDLVDSSRNIVEKIINSKPIKKSQYKADYFEVIKSKWEDRKFWFNKILEDLLTCCGVEIDQIPPVRQKQMTSEIYRGINDVVVSIDKLIGNSTDHREIFFKLGGQEFVDTKSLPHNWEYFAANLTLRYKYFKELVKPSLEKRFGEM